LTDVQSTESTFDQRAARGNDFFVQAMIISAENHDATMRDDYGVCQRSVIHDTRRYAGEMLDMSTDRPDFGSQQAQAHLHQPVIEMREDNIIPANGERCIENDRSDDLGVRMRKTLCALLPASG